MSRVACNTHGDAEATYVCVHIVDTLRDGKPRGFLWSVDEEGEYQAVCEGCRNMSQDEWDDRGADLGRIVCFECYKSAALSNGVDLRDGGTLQ